MVRKNKYWDIRPILKTNADYHLIFGKGRTVRLLAVVPLA